MFVAIYKEDLFIIYLTFKVQPFNACVVYIFVAQFVCRMYIQRRKILSFELQAHLNFKPMN